MRPTPQTPRRGRLASTAIAAMVVAALLALPGAAGATSVLGPTVRVLAPTGAAKSAVATLLGVACSSTSDCTAVGGYLDASSNGLPMAASGTTTSWTRAVTIGLPKNHASVYGAATLKGVACATSSTCVAVGSYADTTPAVVPMVATEAGSTWGAATQLGLPAGAGGNQLSQLTSVSCVDAQTCVAVGSFSDKASRAAIMVANETAGAWHPAVQLALPSDAGSVQRALGNVELSGVSCTDAQDCVAVGSYLNAAGAIVPMRATEAAGIWTRAVKTPMPAGTPSVSSAELYGVDCPQTGSCVAVGYVTTAAGATWPAVEVETSGSWGPVVKLGIPAGTPRATGGSLAGVTCTAVHTCTAVGDLVLTDRTAVPVVAVDVAGKWQSLQRVGSVPLGIPHIKTKTLHAVACPTTNGCVAAGYAYALSSKGYVTDAEAIATAIVPVRPITDPAPPTGVAATPRHLAVLASWHPGDDGGSPITSFTATASPGLATCTSAASSCVIRGLADATSYTVTVTATNAHGTSPPSAKSAAVVPGTPPTAPSGVAVGLAHARAAVRWRASKGSPGDPVTRYVATVTSPGEPTRTCATATLACAVTGLAAGATYAVTVVARNAVGFSPRSAARRFRAR